MKKVCIVTAARSEYGPMRWIIDGVFHDPEMELQLVVTGAHLERSQGYTISDIEGDGYPIASRVHMQLDATTKAGIATSMGRCLSGMAHTFSELKPDIVIVLGDRYELLPICGAALVMNIPIAHISGGDVTLGAIDNEVRNAVTMMARLHFPGVKDSGLNIARMRGCGDDVWVVGEPGLDNFTMVPRMNRMELARNLNIDEHRKWVLVTLHPETNSSLSYNLKMAANIGRLLSGDDGVDVVITKANADFGGAQINSYWESIVLQDCRKFHLYASLGPKCYLSMMRECYAVVGNSSSGIIEAPHLGVPVLNIGNRQNGRHLCQNVFQVKNCFVDIFEAWQRVGKQPHVAPDNYYGDGHTASRIIAHIKEYLESSGEVNK